MIYFYSSSFDMAEYPIFEIGSICENVWSVRKGTAIPPRRQPSQLNG